MTYCQGSTGLVNENTAPLTTCVGQPSTRVERQIKVMLFADIVNFSKLGDDHVLAYLDAMDKLADHLRTRYSLDSIASWGDALFFVTDEATKFAEDRTDH